MITAYRLNLYFSRILMRYCALAFMIFSVGIFLISLIDVFGKSYRSDSLNGWQLLGLALYRTPDQIQLILPLIILVASLAYFVYLAHSQQLMIAQQAKQSLLQLMTMPMVVMLVISLLSVIVLNPLAANFLEKHEQFKNSGRDNLPSLLSVADTGIWLRQEFDETTLIIHALRWDYEEQRFHRVSIWKYHEQEFLQRIEAKHAEVQGNDWKLLQVLRYNVLGGGQYLDELQLQTRIDQEKINNSFTSAATISVWQLAEFIDTIENAGLSAQLHIARFHQLLSQPVLVMAMFLLAAATCYKLRYRQSARWRILAAVSIGISFFIFLETFRSLGLFHEWPVLLSIWMPPVLFFMGILTYTLIQEADRE